MAVFEKKDKEPILSERIAGIIDRSTGDLDKLSRTDEIVRYKYKIKKQLTSNPDILNVLHWNGKEVGNGDSYLDKAIFDYMRLPDMKDTVKSYICFEVNESIPSYASKQIDRNVIFRLISHKDDVKTDWGVNRPDLMSTIIQDMFDWSNVLGLKLVKQYNTPMVVDDDYYYREICYKIEGSNNIYAQNK